MRDELGEIAVIDRFEGEYAVLVLEEQGGRAENFARVELPHGVREGDVLRRFSDGVMVIDAAETLRRRKAARKLLEELF